MEGDRSPPFMVNIPVFQHSIIPGVYMDPHSEKILAKGNEAIAMAAIDSGCLLYFGYPITPQNDIPEYLSKHLPALGGEFIQAESEIASINLLLGASATGARAMTSSSSPGIC